MENEFPYLNTIIEYCIEDILATENEIKNLKRERSVLLAIDRRKMDDQKLYDKEIKTLK